MFNWQRERYSATLFMWRLPLNEHCSFIVYPLNGYWRFELQVDHKMVQYDTAESAKHMVEKLVTHLKGKGNGNKHRLSDDREAGSSVGDSGRTGLDD